MHRGRLSRAESYIVGMRQVGAVLSVSSSALEQVSSFGRLAFAPTLAAVSTRTDQYSDAEKRQR